MRGRPRIGDATEQCAKLGAVLSNEALMAAYQRGDVNAFAELVTRHEKPLWHFLRRIVRDSAAAEDLLQETFLRVVHGASAWQANAKFSTWLYTIARNLCIDHARKLQHRRALSLDGQASDSEESRLHEQLSGPDRGGERSALNRELAARLERAIAALPAAQREVFVMREVLELPFAEIAAAVGASEPTVKSRMRYALEHLRSELAEATSAPAIAELEP
jgi:RNA polymerase sigma-70 factor (ECF subfamily)